MSGGKQQEMDETCAFGEDEDIAQVLETFFKKVDTDGDQKLSSDEILKAVSSSQPNSASDRLENFKYQLGKCKEDVTLDKFIEIAQQMSIATAERVRWVKRLNLTGRLARLLEAGEPFDEMSKVKRMTEADVEALLDKYVGEVRRVVRKELKTIESPTSAQLQPESIGNKFAGVVGKFGDTGMFNEGLESQLGSPDPFMLKGLLRENVMADGSEERKVTSNYKISFTDKQEYARVFGHPDEYVWRYDDPGLKLKEEDWVQNKDIPIFLLEVAKGLHPNIQGPGEAELKDLKAHFIDLRKHYSDICELNHGVFPGDVGHVNIVEGESSYIYCELEHNENKERGLREILNRFDAPVLVKILPEVGKIKKSKCIDRIVKEALNGDKKVTLMQGRRRFGLKELMDIPAVKEAGLSVQEAIQAYQYTGPLFQSWNDVLRKMPFKGTSAGDRLMEKPNAQPNSLASAPKNRYTTSILVLVSSALKLSRHTKIPKGRTVFRGLGRMRLGREWFSKDDRGVSSGVELGFMSTTQRRAVAMEYSGVKGGEMGTIFEFGVGAVDLGAQLDSLSQYPGEGEILFPPLSHLEVIGYPKVEMRDNVPVLVVSVKVNINQKAMTIDEILRRRKHTVTALVEGVVNEIAFDSQIFTSKPWPEDDFRQSVQPWTEHDDEYFNADDNFKHVLDQILTKKKDTIKQFVKDEMKDADQEQREKTLRNAATRGKTEIVEALGSMGIVTVGKKGRFSCLGFGFFNKNRPPLGADVNSRYDDMTALLLATEGGHTETVKALAGLGADVKAVDKEGKTAVMIAAKKGYTALVKELAALGVDVKASDRYDESPIMTAARWGHLATVRELVAHGADVNAATAYEKSTAVMYAAERGHTMTVKELIALGADVKAADSKGATAVIYAAEEGHTATVKELAALGVDVKAANHDGWTAVMFAARRGHTETVKELAGLGADVNAATTDPWTNGKTAIALATEEGHTETVKALVGLGADMNAALSCAVARGQTAIVAELAALGADVKAAENDPGAYWRCS